MCGRFTLGATATDLAAQFNLAHVPTWTPCYNIAPTQEVLVVRQPSPQASREAHLHRWGLVPSWAKDPAIGNRMINARADTILEKPAFRESFKHRRCLIPADGFYEWQAVSKGSKQPFYIHRRDGQVLALAGIWDHWTAEKVEVLSCAIVTIEAGPPVSFIHNRMPAILDIDAIDAWLDESAKTETLMELLRPLQGDMLLVDPVDKRVNKPETDDPECIQPIKAQSNKSKDLF